MKIDVMLFAQARQLGGLDSVTIDVPEGCAVETLLRELVVTVPELKEVRSSLLVAINNQFADRQALVSRGDKVACFPPVSGG